MKALSIQANNVFFTADQHFDHERIIHLCGRPFAHVDDMNNTLIRYHNEIVGPKDIVWHLGDFSFSKDPLVVRAHFEKLNGIHHLIAGNHDHWIKPYLNSSIIINNLCIHPPLVKIKYKKQIMILCHYALAVWENKNHESWMLYGHSHGKYKPPYGKTMDVGVDNCYNIGTDYMTPQRFEDIVTYMSTRGRFEHESKDY